MGVTVLSATVGSRQIGNDDDVDVKAAQQVPTPVVTFTTFGTGPTAQLFGGPGRLRVKATSGTGAGTAAGTNIILTFPVGTRPPRKVYVASPSNANFYIGSIAANVVNIGGLGNSVASTVYDIDLIFAYYGASVLVSEVIERAYNEFLYPSGVNRPTYDKLASALNATDVSFSVTGRVLGKIPRDSVLEIDSELLLVDTVVGNTTINLHPQGRGWLESGAATHTQFAQVLVDPDYSRKTMFNALVSMIGILYAHGAYARKTDPAQVFTTNGTIALPAGGKRTLKILAALGTSTPLYYNHLRRGIDYIEFEEFDPPKIQLLRGGTEGGFLQIVYKADYSIPATEADDLSSLTNPIPATLQGYLPMAVAGYLLQGRDVSRLQLESIQRALATQGISVGSYLNIGNQMLSLFYARYVQPEADRLRERDFGGIEFVRR